VTVAPQRFVRLSKRQRLNEAVDRIVDESACTRREAWLTLGFIRVLMWRSRRSRNGQQQISWFFAQNEPYSIFDAVIPHNQDSADGSAHRAIEDALLKHRRGEFAIRHESISNCVFRLLTHRVH
jgi:hypothetical protein